MGILDDYVWVYLCIYLFISAYVITVNLSSLLHYAMVSVRYVCLILN
jgi:hypothetical protein